MRSACFSATRSLLALTGFLLIGADSAAQIVPPPGVNQSPMRLPPAAGGAAPLNTNMFTVPLTRIAELDRQLWPDELAWAEFKPSFRALLNAWQSGQWEAVEGTFAGNFAGAWPSTSQPGAPERNGVQISVSGSPAPLGLAAFKERLAAHRKMLGAILGIDFDATSLSLTNNHELRASIRLWIRAGSGSGVSFEEQLWDAVARKENDAWRFAELHCRSIEQAKAPLPLFSNASTRLPFEVGDSAEFMDVGYFAEGLSLVDIDADGDADIFGMRKLGSIALLENRGNNVFVDISGESGLPPLTGGRSSWFFDWDNDGDLDLLLVTSERMWAFERVESKFQDVSARSQFNRMFTSALTSAAIADYDRDGFLDFYVTSYGDPRRRDNFDYFDSTAGFFNKLFRNKGDGSFEDVTEKSGLEADNRRWTYAALWIDYNHDLAPDLYVINDYGPKQLFANNGEGVFTDVAAAAGVTDYGNGMGGTWADYDGDGFLDLYLSNIHSWPGLRSLASRSFTTNAATTEQVWRFTRGNTLLKNTGAGRFTDVADTPLRQAGWAWGNTLFDYDNDGDLDVYVVNGMFSNRHPSGRTNDLESHFWRHILAPIANKEQRLKDGSAVMGYRMMQEGYSFAGNQRNAFFQNLGGGRFASLGSVSGADLLADGRAVAAADTDNDGDLDLVLANRNAPELVLLRNDSSVRGNFLALQLIGKKSNRMGIGARVTVSGEPKRQTQVLQLGSGYVSQGPADLWFGLGTAEKADVEVVWPSGVTNKFRGIQAGQRATLTEQIE